MAHLGSRVSALLDGHLSGPEEERCWAHVHACHACRDLVEREGWVKTRLATLSFGPSRAPDHLKDSLLGDSLGGWRSPLAPNQFPTSGTARSSAPGILAGESRSRGRSLAVIGGGAAGACVVGVLALGMAGSPRVEPRPPAANLSGPTAPAAVDTPSRGDRQRPAPPLTTRLVTVREKMAR